MPNYFFAFLRGDTPLLSNDVAKHQVDFPSHVSSVAADVEVGLLLEQLADKVSMLSEPMLNIYFLGTFARESSDDLERVTQLVLVGLNIVD